MLTPLNYSYQKQNLVFLLRYLEYQYSGKVTLTKSLLEKQRPGISVIPSGIIASVSALDLNVVPPKFLSVLGNSTLVIPLSSKAVLPMPTTVNTIFCVVTVSGMIKLEGMAEPPEALTSFGSKAVIT